MENKEISYKFQGEGLNTEEKSWGKKRFAEYRSAYPHLNKLGSLHLLEELVWKESIQERFKKQIGQLGEEAKKKAKKNNEVVDFDKIETIPPYLQKSIDDGLTSIVYLKTKLGMFEDQKTTDEFEKIQQLKIKAAEYRREHPLSFKTTCPHCAKAFYLKRKTEHFEEFKSPFAEDKVLNNKPLFTLYKIGKLTKEEVAKVLGVFPDYLDWLDKKIYGNEVKQNPATSES